jgi:hypothetical protein
MCLDTKEGGVYVNTKSGVGTILKTISIIFGILGFIGGILLGVSAGSAESIARSLLYSESSFDFSFTTALTAWLAIGTFSALIYAVGEIVDQLTSMRKTLERVSGDLAQAASSRVTVTPVSAPVPAQAAAQVRPADTAQPAENAPTPSSSPDGKWVRCGNCGNEATRDYARIRRNCPMCNTPYNL